MGLRRPGPGQQPLHHRPLGHRRSPPDGQDDHQPVGPWPVAAVIGGLHGTPGGRTVQRPRLDAMASPLDRPGAGSRRANQLSGPAFLPASKNAWHRLRRPSQNAWHPLRHLSKNAWHLPRFTLERRCRMAHAAHQGARDSHQPPKVPGIFCRGILSSSRSSSHPSTIQSPFHIFGGTPCAIRSVTPPSPFSPS
jgi:hypothetical protein